MSRDFPECSKHLSARDLGLAEGWVDHAEDPVEGAVSLSLSLRDSFKKDLKKI